MKYLQLWDKTKQNKKPLFDLEGRGMRQLHKQWRKMKKSLILKVFSFLRSLYVLVSHVKIPGVVFSCFFPSPLYPVTDRVPPIPWLVYFCICALPDWELTLHSSGLHISHWPTQPHCCLACFPPPHSSPLPITSHTITERLGRSFKSKPLSTFPVLSFAQRPNPLPVDNSLYLLKHIVHGCTFTLWYMIFPLHGVLSAVTNPPTLLWTLGSNILSPFLYHPRSPAPMPPLCS